MITVEGGGVVVVMEGLGEGVEVIGGEEVATSGGGKVVAVDDEVEEECWSVASGVG